MVHTTRKSKKTKQQKHPRKSKLLSYKPVKSLKSRRSVRFLHNVDIAKVYGKSYTTYIPDIEYHKKAPFNKQQIKTQYANPPCEMKTTVPIYSARTNACLSYIKQKNVKKRVFYVFTHGLLLTTISQIPTNTFLIQTGELCSTTLGDWDSDLLSIFNKTNQFHTLDVFYGKYGATGPKGQIYELLNMFAPNELHLNKLLTYSEKDLTEKKMLFGIYEKDVQSDKHTQLTELNGTNIDTLFEKGITSTNLLTLINSVYSDSINFVVEVACSVATKNFNFVAYAFPNALLHSYKFYSIDAPKARFAITAIEKPEGRTSPPSNAYRKNIIPDITVAFLYDSYTNCMYNVRSLEQLYLLYKTQGLSIEDKRCYVGIHASENSIKSKPSTNDLPSYDDIHHYLQNTYKDNYVYKFENIYVIEYIDFILTQFTV